MDVKSSFHSQYFLYLVTISWHILCFKFSYLATPLSPPQPASRNNCRGLKLKIPSHHIPASQQPVQRSWGWILLTNFQPRTEGARSDGLIGVGRWCCPQLARWCHGGGNNKKQDANIFATFIRVKTGQNIWLLTLFPDKIFIERHISLQQNLWPRIFSPGPQYSIFNKVWIVWRQREEGASK